MSRNTIRYEGKLIINQKVSVKVMKGDITEVKCGAIVNPTDNCLSIGDGVSGFIKRKGQYRFVYIFVGLYNVVS